MIITELKRILNESNNVQLIFYSDGIDYDVLEELGIEENDIMSQVSDIIKQSGINVLSDKTIKIILFDSNNSKVVAVLFDDLSDNVYSFDIIVSEEYQNMGYAKQLIDLGIQEYKTCLEYNPKTKLTLDVVNLKMEKLLLAKNFKIVNKVGTHTIMTYRILK